MKEKRENENSDNNNDAEVAAGGGGGGETDSFGRQQQQQSLQEDVVVRATATQTPPPTLYHQQRDHPDEEEGGRTLLLKEEDTSSSSNIDESCVPAVNDDKDEYDDLDAAEFTFPPTITTTRLSRHGSNGIVQQQQPLLSNNHNHHDTMVETTTTIPTVSRDDYNNMNTKTSNNTASNTRTLSPKQKHRARLIQKKRSREKAEGGASNNEKKAIIKPFSSLQLPTGIWPSHKHDDNEEDGDDDDDFQSESRRKTTPQLLPELTQPQNYCRNTSESSSKVSFAPGSGGFNSVLNNKDKNEDEKNGRSRFVVTQNGGGGGDSDETCSSSSQEEDDEYYFHKLCAGDSNRTTTIPMLRKVLEKDPTVAYRKDSSGRLPLHLLSQNDDLYRRCCSGSSSGTSKEDHAHDDDDLNSFILHDLLHANPRAPITVDDSTTGCIPFVQTIREWMESIYLHDDFNDISSGFRFDEGSGHPPNHSSSEQQQQPDFVDPYQQEAAVITQEEETMSSSQFYHHHMMSRDGHNSNDDDEDVEQVTPLSEAEKEILFYESIIPANNTVISVDPMVLWSIDMLSNFIKRDPRSAPNIIKNVIEKVPCIIKTLLLIDDDQQRKYVFESPLVKYVMLDADSCGRWLIYMIKGKSGDEHNNCVFGEKTSGYMNSNNNSRDGSSNTSTYNNQSSSLSKTTKTVLHRNVIAQERAVSYLETISQLQQEWEKTMFLHNRKANHGGSGGGGGFSSKNKSTPFLSRAHRGTRRGLLSQQLATATSTVLSTDRDDIQKQQHDIFIKLASKELGSELIPALLQLKKQSDFERASTSSVVQYVLDEQLFQPRTICVILLDILFLCFIVIFFILSSNKFFAFPDHEALESSQAYFQPNETNWDLCHNGTLSGLDCEYYRYSSCRIMNNMTANNSSTTAIDGYQEETCYFNGFDNVCNGLHEVQGYSTKCRRLEGVFNCTSSYELISTHEAPPSSSFSTTISPPDNIYFDEDEGTITYACIDRYNRYRFISRLSLVMVGLSGLYFLLRHLCAAYKIPNRILFDYFGIWTLNDIVSVGCAMAIQAIFVANTPSEPSYILEEQIDSYYVNTYGGPDVTMLRTFAAVTVGLLFVKVIGFFKVLNRYLATFVFSLGVIAVDIFWFIWIMLIMIISFAHMFYTINSGSNCSQSASAEPTNPFCRVDTSFLRTYNIILGDFEMEWFTTKFSVFLFVLYTFLVVIIITNFLIAIISDSYDKSMTQVSRYFGRARIMFLVEVKAFLSIFDGSSRKTSSTDDDEKGCCFGLCCCKRRCCRCFLRWNLLIWSFLISLFNFIDEDSSWGRGIFWALVFIFSIAWIYDPRQRLSRWCKCCLRKVVLKNLVYKWIGKVLLYVFSFILGRSSDIKESSFSDKNKKTNNKDEQPTWGGRLEHLKQDIAKAVLESEYRTRASQVGMEDRISKLENDMKDIKSMLEIIMKSTIDKNMAGPDHDE